MLHQRILDRIFRNGNQVIAILLSLVLAKKHLDKHEEDAL